MADVDMANCSQRNVVSSPGCSSSGAVVAEMFVLSMIFVGSVLGNGLILVVIQKSRRSEWTTNYFVLSLGLSNLTVPFMCVLWTMIWIMRGSWLFDGTCKLTVFFHFLNAGVSSGLLACISLDRFYIIVHPLKFKMSRSQTKELIIFVWIFMICSSAPTLYFFTSTSPDKVDNEHFCRPDFTGVEWKVFIMLFFFLAFCSPLIFTVVMYLRIAFTIIIRNLHAKSTSNSFRRNAFRVPRSKIKVLRMLFLQWLVFICCCLPYFLSLVLSSLNSILKPYVYVCLLLLSFSNSTLNVAIYALFSGDFRQGCKRVFCKPDASQAYRLTSLGRKHRIAPFEFSSDHGEGMELRLPEHKPVDKYSQSRQNRGGANGHFNTLEKQNQAWAVRSASDRLGSI